MESERIGKLGTLNVLLSLFVIYLAIGWMLLVLVGTGKTLGNAAIISKDDAFVGVFLLVLALIGTIDLTLTFMTRRRRRYRLAARNGETVSTPSTGSPQVQISCPRCGRGVSETGYFCAGCGFNYRQ